MSKARRHVDHGESTKLLATGAGIGALGAITAIVGAAACPVCVVAAPAFLGVGLYKRWREGSARQSAGAAEPPSAAVGRAEPGDR